MNFIAPVRMLFILFTGRVSYIQPVEEDKLSAIFVFEIRIREDIISVNKTDGLNSRVPVLKNEFLVSVLLKKMRSGRFAINPITTITSGIRMTGKYFVLKNRECKMLFLTRANEALCKLSLRKNSAKIFCSLPDLLFFGSDLFPLLRFIMISAIKKNCFEAIKYKKEIIIRETAIQTIKYAMLSDDFAKKV